MRAPWILVGVGACGFSTSIPDPNAIADADIDAPPMLDAYVPDAPSSCPSVTPKRCVSGSNILRHCPQIGAMAVDVSCAWGCLPGPAEDHCGKLVPSGGAVTTTDLDPSAALQDKTIVVIANSVEFNTDTGRISNVRNSGTGVISGIEFKVTGGVGVFRFSKLVLQTFDGSGVRVTG